MSEPTAAERLPRRGIDTSLGQAGYCEACGVSMPDGPDACLGMLPGVVYACCGHGDVSLAYVVIGEGTEEVDAACDHPEWVTLRNDEALAYFQKAAR